MKITKQFLTLDEQVEHLKEKRKLNIVNKEKLIYYLKNYNYQNFINGYNDPFMMGFRRKNNKYNQSITEQSIMDLFNFDRRLGSFLLSNIQNVERKLNSLFCYYVAETLKNLNINNGELLELEDEQWNKIFNFDSDKNLKKINVKFLTKCPLF